MSELMLVLDVAGAVVTTGVGLLGVAVLIVGLLVALWYA